MAEKRRLRRGVTGFEVVVASVQQTTTTTTIRLSGSDILRVLREQMEIPHDARVEFTVPGGADWSNTSIDIDDDHPVEITFSTSEVVRSDG